MPFWHIAGSSGLAGSCKGLQKLGASRAAIAKSAIAAAIAAGLMVWYAMI